MTLENKGKKSKQSKRVRQNRLLIDKNKVFLLQDAVTLVKQVSNAKFNETIEIHLRLNVDSKQSDQNVRGMLTLPNGSGKTVRVAVFAKAGKAEEAITAGADIVGEEDLIDQIKSGTINFDRCIATPDMMGLVGRVAKVLGPKGLMPNPKLGTVTNNVADAVREAKSGQVEYRSDKTGIIHTPVGKSSFEQDALSGNIQALVAAIIRARPAGVKGNYLLSAYLSSTMGPSIKLDISELIGSV